MTSRPIGASTQGVVHITRYADALIVVFCFYLFCFEPRLLTPGQFLLVMLAVPIWIELLGFFGIYESHRLNGPVQIVRQVVSANFFGALLIAPPAFFLSGFDGLERVALSVTASTAILSAMKVSIRLVLWLMRRRGMDHRYVCIVGDPDMAMRARKMFSEHPEWGLRLSLVGVGDSQNRQYRIPGGAVLEASDLRAALMQAVVDEVWISAPAEGILAERQLLADCNQFGLLTRLLVSSGIGADEAGSHAELARLSGSLRLGVEESGYPDPLSVSGKRAVDLVLGTLLLIASIPVLFAAVLLVKLSSPGPVLFTQTRVGLRGRRFKIFKLRTMIDGAESHLQKMMERSVTNGPIFKDPADWRVTPIGRILRRFSIDELPQLINVLMGDMSLVGPRPLPVHEAASIDRAFWRRFCMKPGLTCLWQVNGRSATDYERWMNYDLQYVASWSLWLDMRLIAKTIPVVFSGRGAY